MKKNSCSSASSPGWVPGCESAWQGSSSISSSNRARRHSAASDSADTGIGTSCSDSVEDHSSSSGRLCFQPLRSQGPIPTAHVMPSPSSSKLSAQSVPGSPWNSSRLSSPVSSPLDMKDPRPVRRWSSLTRLSGQEKSGRTSCHPDAHGSLDRSLLHARADSSSPLKPSTLDLSYSDLPESRASLMTPRGHSLGHQAVGGSPIQPSVRTQMWLSEQMEFRPESTWLSEQRDRMRQDAELAQMLGGVPLPVNTLVKIKEGLLRQRELEIDRQKQQIMQLHARIRENELRAQQVLQNQKGRCEETYMLKTKESPLVSPASSLSSSQTPLCCENGELARRLASAEVEVIHLKEFLKQNTQKYTEDIKKLEEKMKTRDRYISSLKKKCQREQEQNQEKQQRIETLEKYLADLPSLDEVHTQAQQLEEVQTKAQTLQDTVAQLEQSLEESRTRMQEKDALIERQGKREKELVVAVQSLQEKVEKCLEDGVRLPMLDLKHLEKENTHLLEQQSHDSTMIDSQKQQIDRLTLELTAVEKRLQKEKAITQELHKQLEEREEDLKTLSKSVQQKQQHVDNGTMLREAGSLLKEMSLCLLDLKALCSILTQRAQGKEPNLALLLGIKSMSCSSEENEKPLVEDGLRAKLLEVRQLRNDIDELRTIMSDRYAQDMGENCVTQ
ncbi:centrosomal protein of 85 kDa-like isoform 2-T2 [Clarias gariepinus]|uniref:centrosomal protein of 85 kDa-like isoform X2 n=1 Tax=Clarias gariepinus TaxID=13013 RepID=UPI00234D4C92|nr:centrosomal protein of 85 kDa-like isoform X2 [Clarias gariepinus]